MTQHDEHLAFMRMAFAWAATLFGAVTLQQIALLLASIYSALQIYLLIRDRFCRRKAEQSGSIK